MEEEAVGPSTSIFDHVKFVVGRRYQKLLDDITPFALQRWVAAIILLIAYLIRVSIVGGFFIISYALGIYLLNLFIGFLSPQVDPEEELAAGSGQLPVKADDEFKPFVRHLPELKFWHSLTRAVVLAFTCTFFRILDIPVFWPILVIYFFALTFVTLKNQIMHMIKYRYLPFTHGKRRYEQKPQQT